MVHRHFCQCFLIGHQSVTLHAHHRYVLLNYWVETVVRIEKAVMRMLYYLLDANQGADPLYTIYKYKMQEYEV